MRCSSSRPTGWKLLTLAYDQVALSQRQAVLRRPEPAAQPQRRSDRRRVQEHQVRQRRRARMGQRAPGDFERSAGKLERRRPARHGDLGHELPLRLHRLEYLEAYRARSVLERTHALRRQPLGRCPVRRHARFEPTTIGDRLVQKRPVAVGPRQRCGHARAVVGDRDLAGDQRPNRAAAPGLADR